MIKIFKNTVYFLIVFGLNSNAIYAIKLMENQSKITLVDTKNNQKLPASSIKKTSNYKKSRLREESSTPLSFRKKYPKIWFAKDIAVGILSTGVIGFLGKCASASLNGKYRTECAFPQGAVLTSDQIRLNEYKSDLVLRCLSYLAVPIIALVNGYTIKKGYDQYHANSTLDSTKKIRYKKSSVSKMSKKGVILRTSYCFYGLLYLALPAVWPHVPNCKGICKANGMLFLSALTWFLTGFYATK